MSHTRTVFSPSPFSRLPPSSPLFPLFPLTPLPPLPPFLPYPLSPSSLSQLPPSHQGSAIADGHLKSAIMRGSRDRDPLVRAHTPHRRVQGGTVDVVRQPIIRRPRRLLGSLDRLVHFLLHILHSPHNNLGNLKTWNLANLIKNL
eukprot:jgi/Botrbrau1/23005/Bobra.0699s0001.1